MQPRSRQGPLKVARRFIAGLRVKGNGVPAGRLNISAPFHSSLRDDRFILSVPGDKSPGYYRLSLRDKLHQPDRDRIMIEDAIGCADGADDRADGGEKAEREKQRNANHEENENGAD